MRYPHYHVRHNMTLFNRHLNRDIVLVNIDKPWQRIRKRANINDVRIHDLRRTLGSWLAQSGNSLHLIGRILNHADQKTTQVYARFQQDNLRTALDQHGSQIMGIAGKRPTAEIVPFTKEVTRQY